MSKETELAVISEKIDGIIRTMCRIEKDIKDERCIYREEFESIKKDVKKNREKIIQVNVYSKVWSAVAGAIASASAFFLKGGN